MRTRRAAVASVVGVAAAAAAPRVGLFEDPTPRWERRMNDDVLVLSHVAEMAMRTGLKPVNRSPFLAKIFPPAASGPELEEGDELEEVEGLGELLAQEAGRAGEPLALEERGEAVESSLMVKTTEFLGEGATCAECGQLVAACTC